MTWRGTVSRYRLLFRSYFVIVLGLLTVAIVLDLAFERLELAGAPDVEPGISATMQLMESVLIETPIAERDSRARELGETAGIPLSLLEKADITGAVPESGTGGRLRALGDPDGELYYLLQSDALGALLYLGPVAPPKRNALLRLVPPLFYLSIFVLVGLWLRPLLRDIDVMTASAQRFAADYRQPLHTEGRVTQLTSLAQSLDAMSARISGLIQGQKELIAALSHEMRTPLARIRFALAVLGKDANEALEAHVTGISDDVQEIDALIASMLEYARLDHPELRMHWRSVPLESWMREQAERFETRAAAVEVNGDGAPATATMDPDLMGIALSNLLANATRYARQRIRVSASVSGAAFELAVEDDGDGVPEAARASVFKAFSRVDDSRNRDTGGYGLGLAIVARIAALHGGSARIETSTVLGGACFVLSWPRSPHAGLGTPG